MIQFDRKISYQIFPIIRYWLCSLLLYIFFVINIPWFFSSQHGTRVVPNPMNHFVTNPFNNDDGTLSWENVYKALRVGGLKSMT